MKILNKILLYVLLIIVDIVVWLVIGLVLLNYEDFYDESEGEYFSLASMTIVEKIAYLSYYVWIIFNITLIIFFVYRLIKKFIIERKNS